MTAESKIVAFKPYFNGRLVHAGRSEVQAEARNGWPEPWLDIYPLCGRVRSTMRHPNHMRPASLDTVTCKRCLALLLTAELRASGKHPDSRGKSHDR